MYNQQLLGSTGKVKGQMGENTSAFGHEEVIGDLWVCWVSVEWQGQKPDCKEGRAKWGVRKWPPPSRAMKIEKMLAGQGDGTVLRKHSFEEVTLKQGKEERGTHVERASWSKELSGEVKWGWRGAKRERSEEIRGTYQKLELANRGLMGRVTVRYKEERKERVL